MIVSKQHNYFLCQLHVTVHLCVLIIINLSQSFISFHPISDCTIIEHVCMCFLFYCKCYSS